jgi:hypothetical protein
MSSGRPGPGGVCLDLITIQPLDSQVVVLMNPFASANRFWTTPLVLLGLTGGVSVEPAAHREHLPSSSSVIPEASLPPLPDAPTHAGDLAPVPSPVETGSQPTLSGRSLGHLVQIPHPGVITTVSEIAPPFYTVSGESDGSFLDSDFADSNNGTHCLSETIEDPHLALPEERRSVSHNQLEESFSPHANFETVPDSDILSTTFPPDLGVSSVASESWRGSASRSAHQAGIPCVEIELWCPTDVSVKINHRRTFQGGTHRRFCSPIGASIGDQGPDTQYRYTIEVKRNLRRRGSVELCERVDLQLAEGWWAELFVEEPCGLAQHRFQFEVRVFDALGHEVPEQSEEGRPGWRFLPNPVSSRSCPTRDGSVHDAQECLPGECLMPYEEQGCPDSTTPCLTGDGSSKARPSRQSASRTTGLQTRTQPGIPANRPSKSAAVKPSQEEPMTSAKIVAKGRARLPSSR